MPLPEFEGNLLFYIMVDRTTPRSKRRKKCTKRRKAFLRGSGLPSRQALEQVVEGEIERDKGASRKSGRSDRVKAFLDGLDTD